MEKKVYKPHHRSLLKMVRKIYPKSARRKNNCEVGFKKNSEKSWLPLDSSNLIVIFIDTVQCFSRNESCQKRRYKQL